MNTERWGKVVGLMLGVVVMLALGRGVVRAAEHENAQVKVYLFHGESCPHCKKMIEYLSRFERESPETAEFLMLEVYNHPANAALFGEVGKKLGSDTAGVPFLLVGDKASVGFSPGVSEMVVQNLIAGCQESECPDMLDDVIEKDDRYVVESLDERVRKERQEEQNEQEEQEEVMKGELVVKLPVLGVVDLSKYSLVGVSLILGLLDGFNPCAMWVLVFLIGLLLNMEDTKRRWLLGLTFIGASTLVYLLFMTAWLSFFLFVGMIVWVRLAVGGVAIGSGVVHLKKFWEHQTKCELIPAEKRKKIFGKLERITADQRLAMAVLGIILLAFSVNLIELFCSAGLPAIFTNVLSISHLSWWQYGMYMFLYLAMFMLDDMVVFVLAMKTLSTVGVSSKYTHWANLVGGAVIFLLGVLLIFKPGWLMFG